MGIEFDRLTQQGRDVAVPCELLSQRTADVSDAQRSGRALVKQWLEKVARRAV
jgi:hypothetical protein